MSHFKERSDGSTNEHGWHWKSTLITLFHYDFWGDCEDSTVLALWAFKCIGIDAREVILYNDNTGIKHSVALSMDNKYMTSNNELYTLGNSYTLLQEINRLPWHWFNRIERE